MAQDLQLMECGRIEGGGRILALVQHAPGHGVQRQQFKDDEQQRKEEDDDQHQDAPWRQKCGKHGKIRQRGLIADVVDVVIEQRIGQRMNGQDHQQTVDQLKAQDIAQPAQFMMVLLPQRLSFSIDHFFPLVHSTNYTRSAAWLQIWG